MISTGGVRKARTVTKGVMREVGEIVQWRFVEEPGLRIKSLREVDLEIDIFD